TRSWKGERRFREVDLWPIVVEQNIQSGPDSAEQLMAYAKKCGGAMMVDFCFQNWEKLAAIVEKSWKGWRISSTSKGNLALKLCKRR
ncbi:MAG: hypothetical protein AAGJ35_09840, partial [Myxococcota bacterium]